MSGLTWIQTVCFSGCIPEYFFPKLILKNHAKLPSRQRNKHEDLRYMNDVVGQIINNHTLAGAINWLTSRKLSPYFELVLLKELLSWKLYN